MGGLSVLVLSLDCTNRREPFSDSREYAEATRKSLSKERLVVLAKVFNENVLRLTFQLQFTRFTSISLTLLELPQKFTFTLMIVSTL